MHSLIRWPIAAPIDEQHVAMFPFSIFIYSHILLDFSKINGPC